MSTAEQILIVGPSWVGDMVMAQSLFKVLRQQAPDAQIDVIAPAWSTGILERMPEVRRGLVLDTGHGEFGWSKRRQLGAQVRGTGYDRAIVMPRSWKAALIPWFANIPLRTGFRGEWRYGLLNDIRELDRKRYDQTVKRAVALGLPPNSAITDIPFPELEPDRENQSRLMDRLGLKSDADQHRPVLALMPGAAFGPAKMWPLEYFAELAKQATEEGMRVWILGSDSERSLGDTIAGHDNRQILNLCGKTRLEDTADLLSLADATVTNDSGLMHIAAAVGTYVIAIYGSTPVTLTPPLTERKFIHHLNLDCSPCSQRECPLGHYDCLKKIEPAAVMNTLRSGVSNDHP